MALFHEALELPAGDWEAWLDARTGDDPDLRADVLGLLEAHQQTGGVLDRPPPDPTQLMLETLRDELGDRYDLLGEVGRGGMAVVFLARERKHDRRVALKVMRPEVADIYGRERFDREVRLAAQLSHPHILGLIDSGQAGDLLFYVMPFIDGETLRERMDREGPLPFGVADRLMRQIAAALDHAHGMGVVHRDLKPGNVLCAGDHAYIMDFGVAKTLDPLPDADDGDLTRTGLALGTPRYMAPEQALGGVPVDHRADLYAWGMLVHEMLTGERDPATWMGGASGSLRKALGGRRDLPLDLADVVERCLRPNPADRFRSAGELIDALDAARDRAPASRRRPRWWKAGMVGGVAAALVGAFVLWPRAEPPSAPVLSTPVAVAPFANETGDADLDAVGRLAGDWIAQGLQQLGTVAVVPWPVSLESSERARAEAPNVRTNLPAFLAQDVGAGTVITGSIYRIGPDLQLGAVVTDVRRGRIVSAPEPLQVPAGAVHDGIRQLRDRLMGSLAISSDERFAGGAQLSTTPPTFDSYRDFDRGVGAFLAQDYGVAADLFSAAWAKDTTFLVARVYEARSLYNAVRRETADSVLEFLAPRRDRLSQYAALEVDFLRASRNGDGVRALQVSREAATLNPNSRAAWNAAYTAVRLNRPHDGLAILSEIDPDRGQMRGWAQYWTQLAHASHMIGDYEAEVRAANEMFRRYPERRVATVIRARALAAAGDTGRLAQALAETRILPPLDYWSYGAALVAAGIELDTHGSMGDGRTRLEEAVAWFTRELQTYPGDRGHRYWLAHAYYGLEAWPEAEAVLRELAADFPDRGNYQDFWALAIARTTGSREAAMSAVDVDDPGSHEGGHYAYRARLEAVLGDHDRALAHLSEAFQRGVDDMSWLHARAFHDFAPLREDPRFVRLMRPPGLRIATR